MKFPVIRVGTLILLVLGILVTGCSSFRRDVKAVRDRVPAVASPEGRWVGRWHDEKRTGHGGELECVLTRTGAHLYRMSTHSRWWRWFTSSLDVTAVVTPLGPDRFEIRGQRSIWPLGSYTLEGQFNGAEFRGTYRAGRERGVIEMHRP